VPPLEAWEKVWINGETFASDVHSYINCTTCHLGQSVDDMELAHQGLVTDPSENPEQVCASCHPDVAPHSVNSLHTTLAGYDTVLHQRSSPEHYETLELMESYHCDSCHASCGQCHVSQPTSVGGGLLEGHTFVQTPPMSRTCTGCHGSRVKNEYYGLNEGFPGDVHLREARMACTDCHTGAEMHGGTDSLEPVDVLVSDGQATPASKPMTHRYDAPREPTCESCHTEQIGVGSGKPEHEVHPVELMACEVCHSVSYTHCTNCHVERTDDDVAFYSIETHSLGFYIGLNSRTSDRPYKYVPVRHVPVDINSFSFYGEGLLANFLNRATWAYATPHNTQLDTPQTQTCLACHENDAIFLTPDKVDPAELDGANLEVIVEHAPAFPEGYEQYLEAQEAEAQPSESGEEETAPSGDSDADFWGSDSSPIPTESSSDADFWGEDSSPAPTEASSDADFWGSDSTPE